LNERTIWLVRIVGILVFLCLIFLLMGLYARLVRLNQERQLEKPQPKSSSGFLEAPAARASAALGRHA